MWEVKKGKHVGAIHLKETVQNQGIDGLVGNKGAKYCINILLRFLGILKSLKHEDANYCRDRNPEEGMKEQ